jgi:hypothetical protein
MTEKRFESWDYRTVQEVEQLCNALPIVPRTKAAAFFEQAGRATKQDANGVERQSGRVLESLAGMVSASDRKDFAVTYDFGAQSIADGMLVLETYDDSIGVLFCVARISERSFLTRAFTQGSKPAVKRLLDAAPGSGPPGGQRQAKPAVKRPLDAAPESGPPGGPRQAKPGVNVPVLVALAVAAAAVVAALVLTRGGPAQVPAPVLTPEARAYVHAGYLQLSEVDMSAKQSFAQQTLVEVTGKITNTGNRTLKQIDLTCVFRDPSGRVVLRDRVAIVKESLGGLKPGETKGFRLPFDTIPESWNQTLPELVIAQISFG